MINNEQQAIQFKAFRTITKQFNVPQVHLIVLVFIGKRTLSKFYLSERGFHYKLDYVLSNGYIEQVQGKGKRFRVTDKGKDVLNQYYSLVAKLSEVKPTKQATKRLIDSI